MTPGTACYSLQALNVLEGHYLLTGVLIGTWSGFLVSSLAYYVWGRK